MNSDASHGHPSRGEGLIHDLEAIEAYGKQIAPDEFAGAWHRRDVGENEARFLGDLTAHRDALAQRVKHPDRLRLLPARFSLAWLEAVQESTEEEMFSATLEAHGFKTNVSEVDVEQNVVVYEVFAEDPEAIRERFARRYKGAVRIRVLGSSPTERVPAAWRCYDLGSDGRTLRLRIRLRSADEVADVDVSETAEVVEIAVLIDRWLGDIRLMEEEKTASTTLTTRLAGRAVVDVATGEQRQPCA